MTDLHPCTSTEHNWITGHHHDPDGTPFRHRHPGCPTDCPDKAYGPTQSADERATEGSPDGVWVSYSEGASANLTLFPTEIDALRHAVTRKWGVRFLKFGEPFAPEKGMP